MINKSKPRLFFEIFNYSFFTIFCISIVVPFINAIAISLSNKTAIIQGKVFLLPNGFNLEAYKSLAVNLQFLRTFRNTVFLTVVQTALVIILSLAAGYALSSKYMIGKKILMIYIMVPMYFSGGLIPLYLLVNGLGMNNTYFALILPGCVSIFYIIVFRNMINQLPKEMVESAEIDGASQSRTLFHVIIPLIMPTIAAFIVFSAVAHWNEWFGCMIYIRKREMWTLQYQLRDILLNSKLANQETLEAMANQNTIIHPENLKMAALMLTILPIIIVYPFVQKYFMSGVLVGAVKG